MTRFVRRSSLFSLLALLVTFAAGASHAQDEARCREGYQYIEHAMGSACVPENPERIVALEWTYVEDLLALGIQPVGAADLDGYVNWVKIPVELDENVVDVGTRNEPNLEVIASLNPDLIIAVQFRVTESYDDLSAIAPTLVFNPYPEDLTVSQYEEMTTTFTTIAAAVNREAEGQAVLEHMETTYANAQAALEAAGRGGEAFILAQGWTTDSVPTFRLFTDNAMAVQILEQIGLENAWDDAPQLYGYTEIGIEGFADLSDGDFNYFYVVQESDHDILAESPLWNSLPFVAAERAYWMGGDVWLFGGPLSAELLVDTALTAMGVELPATDVVSAVTCDAGLRSVTDAAGLAVCVPEAPERVLALMESDLDALLALGVQPVGTTNGRGQPTPPRYLTDALGDVEIVGAFYTPNLESVLALNPDLILMGGFTDETVLAQLNAIAPTVNTFMLGETWQAHFLRVAEVMDMQAEADAFLATYDERVQTIAAALGENAGAEVSIVRWNPDGPGIMLPNAFSSRVLADLGLVRPTHQQQGEGVGHTPPLSLEDLGQIDADWIFIGTLAAEGDAVNVMNEALAGPLYQQLSAVQNDHVVFIDGSLWTSIGGPLAAMAVLDDVEAAMTAAGA